MSLNAKINKVSLNYFIEELKIKKINRSIALKNKSVTFF